MAHGHDFSSRMVVLKTSQGYLTKEGFTQDITSPDILSVRAYLLGGKWAPKHARIESFKKHFNISIEIDESESEFFTYHFSDKTRSNLYRWF